MKILKKKTEKLTNRKGITLIALVITIIVLLILAGVTISALSGDNGILTNASKSKIETEESSKEESRRLTTLEATTNIDGITHKDSSTGTEKTVEIPAGFAVSQVEGENTIEDGLVIIDKNENEWVWIEVPKEITAETNSSEEIFNALNNYTIDYRLSYNTDVWYEGCGLTKDEYNAQKDKMLYSIKEKGGFWIGRYESGSETPRKSSSDNLTKMIIKQDKYPYNFVTVSQAQYLANQLSTTQYTCSLIFDIQWDLTCKYLEEMGAKTQEEIKINSNSWGNYIGDEENEVAFTIERGEYSLDDGANFNAVNGTYKKENSVPVLLTTGASERNKVLNIYDFAGNVDEWTLGKIPSIKPSLFRSGPYNGTGTTFPAWTHPNRSIDTSLANIGFRVTIY